MELGLRGKTAVVTGGLSGLGKACALGLAAEGAWVLCVDIRREEQPPIGELLKDVGGSGEYFQADVAQRGDMERVVARAIEVGSSIDILVNSAGLVRNARITEMSEEEWRLVVDVNLSGVWWSCRSAIAEMLRQPRGGVIINIASVAGMVAAFRGQPAYIAAKGGVVQLTKALAMDYATDGIRVNCVCPGVMDTPMIDEMLEGAIENPDERREAKNALRNIQPIRRMSSPEDVAKVVVFLASPHACDMTGAIVPVDGGMVAQ